MLLVDVLIYLYKHRQNSIFKLLYEYVQTLVSSSTLSELDDSIKKKAKIITLEREMK